MKAFHNKINAFGLSFRTKSSPRGGKAARAAVGGEVKASCHSRPEAGVKLYYNSTKVNSSGSRSVPEPPEASYHHMGYEAPTREGSCSFPFMDDELHGFVLGPDNIDLLCTRLDSVENGAPAPPMAFREAAPIVKGHAVAASHHAPTEEHASHDDMSFLLPLQRSSSSVNGSCLLDYVRGHLNHRLPTWRAVRIFRQMVKALQELGRAHEQVCLDNFVVERESHRVYVLVHKGHHGVTPEGGRCLTASYPKYVANLPEHYRSPESLVHTPSSAASQPHAAKAADVYALGCCLFPMLCGRWLFHDEVSRTVVHTSGARELLRQHEAQGLRCPGPQAQDLIAAMTAPDPAHRPSLDQIWEHPWCTSFAHYR